MAGIHDYLRSSGLPAAQRHLTSLSTLRHFLLRTTRTTRTMRTTQKMSVLPTKLTKLSRFGLAAGLGTQPLQASNLQNFAQQNTSQTE